MLIAYTSICETRVIIINIIHLTLLEKFFVTSGWEAHCNTLRFAIEDKYVSCVLFCLCGRGENETYYHYHSTTSGVRYTNRTFRNVPTVHGHSVTPAQPNWTLILIKSSPLTTHQQFTHCN